MARSPLKLIPHVSTSVDYHKLHGAGRLAIYLTEIASQEAVIVNIYGHTGGHTDL